MQLNGLRAKSGIRFESSFNQLFWSKFLESYWIVAKKLIISDLDLIENLESDWKRFLKSQ